MGNLCISQHRHFGISVSPGTAGHIVVRHFPAMMLTELRLSRNLLVKTYHHATSCISHSIFFFNLPVDRMFTVQNNQVIPLHMPSLCIINSSIFNQIDANVVSETRAWTYEELQRNKLS